MVKPSLLNPRCARCPSNQDLKSCTGCKVQQYCSETHQREDWTNHKKDCKSIKKSRMRLEEAIQEHPNDPSFNTAPLSLRSTYITYRSNLIDSLMKIHTKDSVSEALEHGMIIVKSSTGIIGLDPVETIETRDLVPFLMIRLEQDQEAYDYVRGRINMQVDPSSPFSRLFAHQSMGPKVSTYDVFESVDQLCSMPLISSLVAGVLLKVKFLIDLTNLKLIQDLNQKIPQEIIDRIKFTSLKSQLIFQKKKLILKDNWDLEIKLMIKHIKQLKKEIDLINPKFFVEFFDIKKGESIQDWLPPHKCRCGPNQDIDEQMQLVFRYSCDAWKGVEGAVEVMKNFL
ncbi:uncharacterized protein MELLADRAFT_117274 [Melampsora larici-populina 98AG31]|uniref:MYND-type domain-containing protein n=1 Tax=Melampsora larici-populina (strain 98AG31 / pathotype 3-4-7) TaxID=747676 RepID=F4RVB3_MELLP|nr:uncharacterized protein MELLADRAFT_117274 [Melampsora larici-populina 98AG31]EGG03593.1 hypothetical protein MELLADRAFT_117274 [Melampsora larici-populina 98AG31]